MSETQTQSPAFDAVAFTMAFEEGSLTEDQVVEGFQQLINSGLAWQLQGSYGRAAKQLIDEGRCTAAPARNNPTKVGPYEGVSKDIIRQVGEESYRILLYAAYNAMGLIGSEYNGIAVLSEDRTNVVADNIGVEPSGYFGPSAKQTELFEKLSTCDADEFRAIVNRSSRLRYLI